jgi:hypothetical protein
LKKWKTSELCDNDGTNSENSSTDTFIVKGSEDEIDKEVDNLPDVTKGTKINLTQNDELLTEKSKSEPDLKQVSEEPRRPRSAKSHIKLNETSTENKFSSSFGMPRTVSGNLKDVFENYKKEGQFMRYKTPTFSSFSNIRQIINFFVNFVFSTFNNERISTTIFRIGSVIIT